VEFHAGATRVGKNGVNTFTFQSSHQDITAAHGGAYFGFVIRIGTAVRSRIFRYRFTHCTSVIFGWPVNQAYNKKPTTVASRGFLSKVSLNFDKPGRLPILLLLRLAADKRTH
jgi:hypothetical protein